jgi:outer membrane protein
MKKSFSSNPHVVRSTLAIALSLAALSSAKAQSAGDWILNVGLASINPSGSISPLTSVGPASPVFTPALNGAKASISKATTQTLGVLHMFTDNLGLEATIGIPPKLTVDVQLTSGAHPGAASAKALYPSFVGKYFFQTPQDLFRPYAGLGFTTASFNSVGVNTADPLVNGLGGTSSSLSSSVAPMYTLGALYRLDEKWSINGSVTYVPLKSNATFVGTGTTTTGSLTINPTEYVLRVGYKF